MRANLPRPPRSSCQHRAQSRVIFPSQDLGRIGKESTEQSLQGQGWAVSRAGLSIQRSHTEQCTGCVEWVSAEGAQAQGILAEVIELQLSSGGHRDTLPMRPHLLRSSGAKAWGQTGPGNDAQSSQFNSKSPL